MEKIDQYRQIVKQLLTQYASFKPSLGDVEMQTIFDIEHDHYQIVRIGWQNKRRVYGCSIHLDIKDGKIWIQWNATEIDIGQELADLGIPKEDIVVGFHTPYMRQFTDYAVG